MAQGYTNTHMTTTHTATVTETRTSGIRFDPTYLKTIPGMLKIAEIVLDLLGFICISSTYLRYHSRGTWFNTVAMGGFWFTGILLVLYLFHVIERFHVIPWLKIEFVFCAVETFFYLIAAALAADFGSNEAFAAASFFGFVAMICYGYDAFRNFEDIKHGKIAQGDGVIIKSTETSTTTTPAY